MQLGFPEQRVILLAVFRPIIIVHTHHNRSH